jgi:hypothetical protein
MENRDTVEIFRNPESLRDEQSCKVDAVLRGNFAFDRISIASFDGAKLHEVDEVRVGTHFLAVTGRWGHNSRLQPQMAKRLTPMLDAGCLMLQHDAPSSSIQHPVSSIEHLTVQRQFTSQRRAARVRG